MCFQNRSTWLIALFLKARVPSLKLVRITMLVKPFQVFCQFITLACCLLPNSLSDEELFCDPLIPVEALSSITTFSHLSPIVPDSYTFKTVWATYRRLVNYVFSWCCHQLSMWSVSYFPSLKAIIEKSYLKLYHQNCYFGGYINWQMDCILLYKWGNSLLFSHGQGLLPVSLLSAKLLNCF